MKYQEIKDLIDVLDDYAREVCAREYGLPMYGAHEENMVRLVCSSLNVVLDEDPRIESIMNFTGCSRKAAENLINSGEI
jgi:hypothetical protein